MTEHRPHLLPFREAAEAGTEPAAGPASSSTTEFVDTFNRAWNDHDLEAALGMISDDCVFDATSPAPDGSRLVGRAAIREAWAPIFADTSSHFTTELAMSGPDFVVQCWRYDFGGGHVRGIDLITVRDGKVTAKLAYVKG